MAGGLGLFLLLAWLLARGNPSSPGWWLCLLLQGNLVLVLAYMNHDLLVHRKLLPTRLRWVLAAVLTWPSQLRAGLYEQQHLVHHRALGTAADTEAYKQALDTPLRRVLYATPAALFLRMVIFRGRTASFGLADSRSRAGPGHHAERARIDRAVWLVLAAAAGAALVIDYRLVLYGYLAPLLLVTPLINSIRLVLEHFDLDLEHPLWVGTFYRTGPLTRWMFWWGAGDCHMVHHFYPSIPFYRTAAAVRLIRPVLLERGVVEHRSLLPLLWQWFGGRRLHGTRPAAAQAGRK